MKPGDPTQRKATRNQISKGKFEARISEAIVKFEREFMGRGQLEARTYIIEDMVVVRLQGVLTVAEHQLAAAKPEAGGRELIKKMREMLIENGRPVIEAAIEEILGRKVRSMHTDISTVTGERIIVFIF